MNLNLIQKTKLTTDPKSGKEKWQSPKNKIAREMVAASVDRQLQSFNETY